MGRTTRNKEGQTAPAQERRAESPQDVGDKGMAKLDNTGTGAKLDTLLEVINKLDVKVDTVVLDLNLLRADQQKVAERVTRVETEVAGLQPQTKDLCNQLKELTIRVSFLE